MKRRVGYTLTPEPSGFGSMHRFATDDGCVNGVADVSLPGVIAIYEFASCGRIGAVRALFERWRKDYKCIVAVGIGSDPTDRSWRFWKAVFKAGYVDELKDDDMVVVASRRC
jgi:hypothetical protein